MFHDILVYYSGLRRVKGTENEARYVSRCLHRPRDMFHDVFRARKLVENAAASFLMFHDMFLSVVHNMSGTSRLRVPTRTAEQIDLGAGWCHQGEPILLSSRGKTNPLPLVPPPPLWSEYCSPGAPHFDCRMARIPRRE